MKVIQVRPRFPSSGLLTFGHLLLLSILLAGCNVLDVRPLPTLASKAVAPDMPALKPVEEIPVTFTVESVVLPVVANQPASMPTSQATPTLKPTAIPSPTPVVLAEFLPQTEGVPFLETPPTSTPCNGQGLVFQSRFPSEVGGTWRKYHAYLPPCYSQDGHVYPVVYLIHGSIQTDSHWLDLGLQTYADAGINGGRYPPFIAIMPFSGQLGNISSGGHNSIEGITLEYLLPYVDSNYCSWAAAEGRSIGGISRGGYWALEIAFKHQELFGTVSGHSSHLRFETDPAKYNPLATYASIDQTSMRIWLDRGEKDFLRRGQDQLHDRLIEAGIVHEYRINPGGHSDAYWAEHLPEYLDWHLADWSKRRDVYPDCTIHS